MKTNFKDYKWLAAFAKDNGLNFRFDPTISAKDSGDKSNLKDRLSNQQLEKLYKDPIFFQKPVKNQEKPDLTCSAGTNLLAIGFDGKVYPCIQYKVPLGDLKTQEFSEIWSKHNKPLNQIRENNVGKMPECLDCKLLHLCQRCPGIALLEDKTVFGPSRIACDIAAIQHKIHLTTESTENTE
jgi:radical SAM protein with 4Fe4S-binding SPASM domain